MTTIFEQFLQIWQKANEEEREEITHYAVYFKDFELHAQQQIYETLKKQFVKQLLDNTPTITFPKSKIFHYQQHFKPNLTYCNKTIFPKCTLHKNQNSPPNTQPCKRCETATLVIDEEHFLAEELYDSKNP